LTFIETSELKQSFQTYASGLNAIKPNVLAFEHINSKLKFRLQQCSLISKQGMVKLLAILKQNQVSLGNKPKIKLILQTKTQSSDSLLRYFLIGLFVSVGPLSDPAIVT
jgi:DNA-binding transcriptional regulator WhiA